MNLVAACADNVVADEDSSTGLIEMEAVCSHPRPPELVKRVQVVEDRFAPASKPECFDWGHTDSHCEVAQHRWSRNDPLVQIFADAGRVRITHSTGHLA